MWFVILDIYVTKFSSLTGHIVLSWKQTLSRNKTVHNDEVPSGAYNIFLYLFFFWRAGCQRLVAAEEGCRPPLLYNAALLL